MPSTTLFSAKVNFQPTSAPSVAGYSVDGGAVFGARGNGQSYGWRSSNTANMRDRNATRSPDQRFDTLAYMQRGSVNTWEIAVPNGTYTVLLVAGDASALNSIYRLNAEGTLAISNTPSSSTRWFTGTLSVTVSDGKLTVSNAEGANNFLPIIMR